MTDSEAHSEEHSEAKSGTGISPLSAYRWLALPPEDLLRACGQARFQGSGPGGRKRNRVYSGVRLTHAESGLTAESVDSRASLRNLHAALARLRMNMALSSIPSDWASASTRAGFGKETALPVAQPVFRADANPAHVDYPRFVLRALLLLARNQGQLAPAAASLECTASALTRFFKSDKGVWARARAIRAENGLHPLK